MLAAQRLLIRFSQCHDYQVIAASALLCHGLSMHRHSRDVELRVLRAETGAYGDWMSRKLSNPTLRVVCSSECAGARMLKVNSYSHLIPAEELHLTLQLVARPSWSAGLIRPKTACTTKHHQHPLPITHHLLPRGRSGITMRVTGSKAKVLLIGKTNYTPTFTCDNTSVRSDLAALVHDALANRKLVTRKNHLHQSLQNIASSISGPVAPSFQQLGALPRSLNLPSTVVPSPAAMSMQKRDFSQSSNKSLNINNINPHVKEAKYAVRGELAIKSEQYRAQLAKGEGKDLPFDSVISANIGNPQQLDQKPITFFRQVASLVENPQLLEHGEVLKNGLGYKSDVVERAKALLKDVKSVGAYSQSQGAPRIRQSVADFIERRDGFPADPQNIYLCGGASAGVNALMSVICASPNTGVLVPIPQYPLYTATLSLLNAQVVPYYLKEEDGWSTDVNDMRSALKEAQNKGIDVRAVVVINPGNPTGGSLEAQHIESVLELVAEEKLVMLADEVYQTNVFEGEFQSFKKILRQLQKGDKNKDGKFDNVELASLHSISKGMVGECGHRGGYYEMIGFDPEVCSFHLAVEGKSLTESRWLPKFTSSSALCSAHRLLDNAWLS